MGNDVVDLADPRCRGKAAHHRFLRRVCAPGERQRIGTSPDPDRTLWRIWAAKEAAFKVVSKLRGAPPPFEHALFEVEEEPGRGTVAWRDLLVPWREDGPARADLVHVVAWTPDTRPELDVRVIAEPGEAPPVERLSDRERRAIHSAASGWVRIAARSRAAELLGAPEPEIEIVCGEGPPGRTFPRLLLRGRAAPWDVSLSHHGRWVAWALGRSREADEDA